MHRHINKFARAHTHTQSHKGTDIHTHTHKHIYTNNFTVNQKKIALFFKNLGRNTIYLINICS
jgi:hypothetical protein